jgi:P-type Ca2+ transporter type 2C
MTRPTITIDTSAVSSTSPSDVDSDAVPLRVLPDQSSTLQEDQTSPSTSEWPSTSTTLHNSNASHRSQASRGSVSELRASGSFESRESRPTSPHNVYSPVLKGSDRLRGFLSVPGARSREGSVGSEEAYQSTGTYAGDTHILTASGSSVQGDKDTKIGIDYSKNDSVINDSDALKPDPGTERDFEVKDNKFAFSPGILNKLINPKSLAAFHALGGLSGLERGLRTNRLTGLGLDETTLAGTVSLESIRAPLGKAIDTTDAPKTALARGATQGTAQSSSKNHADEHYYDRKRVFGDNTLPEKKGKTLLQLMWITYNDKVLILLSIAAAVSLAIGLYQTFGTVHDAEHPPVEWVEGVAIIVAIAVVVLVGSLNDYQKERQFVKLNKKKQDRKVNVVRSGKSQELSVYDILAGDVVLLEPGDVIPVDGVYIDGYNVKCDESQTTGESDLIHKKPADEVYTAIEDGEDLHKMDPFILSGSQVVEGVGRFLVTSTGINSSHGKIMMSLREDPEITPLQSKLNRLAEYIAKLGGAAGLLLFVVLFVEFLVRLPHNSESPTAKAQEFMNIFIVTVTIIVVAVPEGLPLAVTLALAFATTRMTKDNNLVRHLKACEVMGNATAICSDKTGTLTQNKMQVVAGTIGTSSRFGGTTNPSGGDELQPGLIQVADDVMPHEVVSTLSQDVKNLLKDSVAINSTAYEADADAEQGFIGSKTETSLLIFARDFLGMGPVSHERSNAKIVQLIPFDSKRKCMGVVLHLDKGKYRLYVKGASEILLEQCTEVIRDPAKNTSSILMSDEHRTTLNNLITSYAERSLRTIGLVYRDFDRWPPRNVRRVDGDPNEAVFGDIFKNMVLLAIVGIQDPLREGVKEAVQTCKNAGVRVRMVTGDNLITARAIAGECGIYTPDGVVMEGPAFRKLSKKDMDEVIPSLQVLARSSPEDKRKLVKRLKELGETVAVTGDGTNDAPALRTADVGFSMGISGTEVAKEASAIILMDDNFASIVKAIMWGRAVNDAVKKFLQFQVTVNITAVVLTFVTAVSSESESSILTAVQLLWVNLIMDTMAALALATDAPTPSILNREPEPKSAPIITTTMWKMIFGETIYQLAITLMLRFGSAAMFAYTPEEERNIPTFVFNTFVWMQIFNQWNNRRLDNKFNIFEGMLQNYFFIGINAIMIGGQVMIIYIGGDAFDIEGLTGEQWGYSIFFGFLSIPIGAIIRLIPDGFVRRLIPRSFSLNAHSKRPELRVEDDEQFSFPKPLQDVKEELSFLKRVKGGRLNNLVFAMQHPRETFLPRSRSGSRSRSNSAPGTPTEPAREDSFGHETPKSRMRSRSNRSRSNSALGATTVMAGIIAGSVAGWSPIERGHGETDPLRLTRPRGRSELGSRDYADVSSPSTTKSNEYPMEHQSLNNALSPVEAAGHDSNLGASLAPPLPSPHKGRGSPIS